MSGPSLSRARVLKVQRTSVDRAAALPTLLALGLIAGCAVPPSSAVVPGSVPVQPASGVSATTTTPALLLPTPSILTAKLKRVSTKGIGSVSVLVTTTDGMVLTSRAAGASMTPASVMKLLSTSSSLDALGAGTTFSTRVVQVGTGKIVLVGGGDPMLTSKMSKSGDRLASLQSLAQATAKKLKASGRKRVALSYNASLFSGPQFSPLWKPKWKGYEARVAALEMNYGKLDPWKADPNPPRTAATAFARWLKKYGVSATAVRARTSVPASAVELARVTSAPVSTIIRNTLLYSNNVAAETLARHAAIAKGQAPSFTGAARTVKAWLLAQGLLTGGITLLDASGLAPGNKLTATLLAAVIRHDLADATMAPIITSLPVAGVSGTLKDRFDDKSELAGRVVVHAKTGTLTGVASLVGYLTTADGATLVFAELANAAKTYNTAYNWLDREAAATASCGCR